MIYTESIQLGYKTAAWFTANPTVVLLAGQIAFRDSDGKYKIGDGTTQLSALTFYGGVSSSGLTVGTSTITSGTDTRILYNNAGVLGEYLVTGTGTTAVLSTSPTFTTSIFSPIVYGSASSGGTLTIDSTSHATKGAITYGTVSSSNIHRFNTSSGTGQVSIQGLVGTVSQNAIYVGVASGSETSANFFTKWDGNIYLNSQTNTSGIILSAGDSPRLTVSSSASGTADAFLFQPKVRTSLTTTTNAKIFRVASSTQTWAAGSVPLVYNNIFEATTLAASSASTFTLAANLVTDVVTGGNNATITTACGFYNVATALTNVTTGYGAYFNAPTGASTNYALGVNGVSNFLGNVRLTQTVTTESVVSDTTVTIVINGTTYKLLARA